MHTYLYYFITLPISLVLVENQLSRLQVRLFCDTAQDVFQFCCLRMPTDSPSQYRRRRYVMHGFQPYVSVNPYPFP